MADDARCYQAWGDCGECGFHGLMAFARRDGEDYDDPEALGVVLDSTCPACGHEEAVLMVIEEYRVMVRLARGREQG